MIAAGGKPRFYQGEFGPAVMSACGQGYLNPDLEHLPELKAFLNLERDTIDCAVLGASVTTMPLSPMQRAFRYQEMTVAMAWRWSGVSWSGLAPLYGLMFGLTTLAAYGLFRTAAAPILAAAGALAMAVSTIQLIYLPHFRDYSKAPFLLLAVLALAWMARSRMSPRRLVALAAGFGLLIGVGVGFRNDLLIAVPPFIATVLLFLPGPLKEGLSVKLAAIAACLLAIWVAMAPMRAIYAPGGGNSMQHVLILGLGDSFNADLGVSNDRLYSWGSAFKDEYAHAQASSYATRMWGARHALALYGPDYDRAASAFLAEVARGFPADMLVRIYASVIRTLGIPYNTTSRQPPTLVAEPDIVRGYAARDRVLRFLGAVWPWVIGAALMGLTVANLRLAGFVAMIVFYFAAYPVLQFNERHFFHLEVIAWWALLLVAHQLFTFAAGLMRRPRRDQWIAGFRARQWVRPVAVGVAVWLVAASITVAPLFALRRYQGDLVRERIHGALSLEKEPIDRSGTLVAPGVLRLMAAGGPTALPLAADDAIESAYVVMEFAAGACESLQFDVTLRYAAVPSTYDFTHTIQVRPPLASGGIRRLFAAVYSHPRSSATIEGAYYLAGLDLPEESAGCLSGLFRVRDAAGVALLPDLNLPPNWEQVTPFQTLDGIEARHAGEPSPEIYTFPTDLPVGRSTLVRPLTPFLEDDIEQRSATLAVTAAGWRVDGAGGVGGRGPFLYLAQMKPRDVRQGDLVLAHGRLEYGGLSLGLIKDGRWLAQVPVTTPGDFAIVIRVPEDGAYSVVLANNVTGRSLENRLTVDRIGWADGR